ncbi:MAG TPA: hypothetical protein VMT11_13270 [Myxococcaceae bacterium]|nr:hypothetical protein [Myxococcaceae bacterium]
MELARSAALTCRASRATSQVEASKSAGRAVFFISASPRRMSEAASATTAVKKALASCRGWNTGAASSTTCPRDCQSRPAARVTSTQRGSTCAGKCGVTESAMRSRLGGRRVSSR